MKRTFESAFSTSNERPPTSHANSTHMQIHPISHEDFSFAASGAHMPNAFASHLQCPSPQFTQCFQPHKKICIRADSFDPTYSEMPHHGGWNLADARHQNHYNLLKQTLHHQHMLDTQSSTDTQCIDIVVHCMNGRKIDVMIDPTCHIDALKNIIMRRLHLEPRQQRLVHKGKLCPDNHRIMDLGITNKSQLHLILQLRGGTRQ